MFRRIPRNHNTAAIGLYRKCMRTIGKLQEAHRNIWYDYVRLKYQEYANVRNTKEISKLISEGNDELQWVNSVIDRKKDTNHNDIVDR